MRQSGSPTKVLTMLIAPHAIFTLLLGCLTSAQRMASNLQANSIVINGNSTGFNYDGHGALSAGASSRLLYDYDNATRSDILDYLFKPNFGANLHMIKVEIGGDGQSTDGTEASHMHSREDLSCKRPYEFWLLEEARKRNPDIKTYALSWAVPYWIGNQTGYYSQDNIDYHIKWLECTKQYNIGNIDYIGNWNERPWGPPEWSKQFRQAMDSAGFQDTKIIIPDGGFDTSILKAMDSDADFKAAIDGIGLHYPCDKPHPEVQAVYGKKYWSSEDYSTVGDWAGAGCWGRILNQNFVRMNMTSTIAWSLIWSVYNVGFPYFGNGLMYAFEPWSGHYTVNGPIWTSAHTCQFTQPGWKILATESGATGLLPKGGSYLTMVSPDGNFSMVIEKLEGKCLRCAGESTQAETVKFQLSGGLESFSKLQFWSTNETHQFVQLDNVIPSQGSFQVELAPDTIYTVSSWFNGQSKGNTKIAQPASFPKPHADDFDAYPVDGLARFLADDGGSFQISDASEAGRSGKVLKQWVQHENGVNRWGKNVPPISYFGSPNWTDTTISIDVRLQPNAPPPPAPPQPYKFFINGGSGDCLDVNGESKKAGGVVDTYPCVQQDNELFSYSPSSGHIIGKESQLCVTNAGCPSSPFCQVECDQSNTTWTFKNVTAMNAAGGTVPYITISPSHDPSMCVQAGPDQGQQAVPLSLKACDKKNAYQWWTMANTLTQANYGGVCARVQFSRSQLPSGLCLTVSAPDSWTLRCGSSVVASGTLKTAANDVWHALNLTVSNGNPASVVASVNNTKLFSSKLPQDSPCNQPGMAAVASSYGIAWFDNLAVE